MHPTDRLPNLRSRAFAAAGVATLGLSLVMAIAPAVAKSDNGNSGTVKVHEVGQQADNGPDTANDPHVCQFWLGFYFATNDSGTWEIYPWSAGADAAPALAGTYVTADGFASTGPMWLTPDHYKLFWLGTNEHSWKHKVFWVDSPCPDPSIVDPGSDPGTDPGNVDPGTEPGSDPGNVDPGSDPGTDPGNVDPGTDPGIVDPGTDPGTDPGNVDPGSDPGSDPGNVDPGTDPGADPGNVDPGTDPGADPGNVDPGTDPGSVDPGSDPANVDPGTDPGSDPGNVDPGTDPGADPGNVDPGTDPSNVDPGSDPGNVDPGSDPGIVDPGTDPGSADPGSDPDSVSSDEGAQGSNAAGPPATSSSIPAAHAPSSNKVPRSNTLPDTSTESNAMFVTAAGLLMLVVAHRLRRRDGALILG